MKRRLRVPPSTPRAQRGASLIVALLMLVAVLLLGLSAAQVSLQGEKASRNERDRQIAFQAAEAALMDAELDIENSPDAARSRSNTFSNKNTFGFPEEAGTTCVAGIGNSALGLCSAAKAGAAPAWQVVDFLDESAGARSVPFGRFTGQRFQTGVGSLPARLPRYVIEPVPYRADGAVTDRITYAYRVTAIGFGVHETTRVLLQTIYRKDT